MKYRLAQKLIASTVAIGITALAAQAQQPRQATEIAEVKAQYETIMTRLDQGGELLLIVNLDGMLQKGIDTIIKFADLGPAMGAEAAPLRATLKKIPAFLKKNGFYAVNGIGLSSVPLANGMSQVKTFVSRDSTAAGMPLWRGLVGYKQRTLASTAFVPKDAIFFRSSTAELRYIWQIVEQGVKTLAPAQASAAFDGQLAAVGTQLGVSVDTLIKSLGDEGFVSFQAAPDKMIPLGPPGSNMQIPSPSLLVAIAVKDETLVKLLDTKLTNPNTPLTKSEVGSAVLRTMNMPMPGVPIPFQPTYTTHGGFFLFGTTADVVTQAINAFDKKNGLMATSEYKKLMSDLPMKNNGITYVSPRLSKLISDIQKMAMNAAGPMGAEEAKMMQAVMDQLNIGSGAFVTLNFKSGVLVKGRTTAGAKQMVATAAIAPIGLMAAIAIPSFMEARGTAQNNACINNLRMIDSAKEQWAMENRKADGDVVNVGQAVKYIRGGALPVCPQGGTYTVGTIGADPRCSIHGGMMDMMR